MIIAFSAEKLQVEILKKLTSEDFLANYQNDKAKKVVFDKGTTKYGMNASECIRILLLQKKAKMLLDILRSHYSDYLVSLEFLKQQKTILKYRKMYRKLFGTISHLKYPKIQFCIITQRFRPEITQPLHNFALTF